MNATDCTAQSDAKAGEKNMYHGKTVVLGVCGGIAAYKCCEIISKLKKLGIDVRVVMTDAAREFITPLTLQTLSKNEVSCDMFAPVQKWDINHISLAQAADVMLIAPATANVIGKIANGITDNLLTTTAMATNGQIIIVPAMNCNMYENPITQENIQKLSALGYIFVEPGDGMLACGVVGKGRLAPVDAIVEAVTAALSQKKDLVGKTVVVTAGPTREKIDDVRYITNHSSGKMGYAVAKAAAARGAEVILISGKVNLPPVSGVESIFVDSAQDMYDAVMSVRQRADVIIKAAAVGDFYVKNAADGKLKKDDIAIIELEKNPDIIAELGKNKTYVLVGFCMETVDLIENAIVKLVQKNADIIVANDLTEQGAGFGVDTNIVKFIFPDGTVEHLPKMSKVDVANELLDRVAEIM